MSVTDSAQASAAFGRSKVGAYPPARKGIQFALRHAAFAQRGYVSQDRRRSR